MSVKLSLLKSIIRTVNEEIPLSGSHTRVACVVVAAGIASKVVEAVTVSPRSVSMSSVKEPVAYASSFKVCGMFAGTMRILLSPSSKYVLPSISFSSIPVEVAIPVWLPAWS